MADKAPNKQETKTKYPQGLIDILTATPNLKVVYMNDKHEWVFGKRDGFKPVNASEIVKSATTD